MAYCETDYLYDRLRELLLSISDGRKPSDDDRLHLKQMLDEWADCECPDDGCKAPRCRFADREDWIEFHGWPNLYDLIESLDPSKPIDCLPQGAGPPTMRRPGHFNP